MTKVVLTIFSDNDGEEAVVTLDGNDDVVKDFEAAIRHSIEKHNHENSGKSGWQIL